MDGRFIRTFSLSAGLRVARLIIGLLIASQLARHVGADGFGKLSVAMAAVAVLLCFGELGFSRYTVKMIMTGKRSSEELLGVTVGARLIVSCLLFAGLCLGVILFRPEGQLLLLLYGVQLLTNPITEVLCWFESRQRMSEVAVAQFIGFFASAVCILVGVWFEAPLYFFAITYAVEGWTFLGLSWWWFHQAGGRVKLSAFRFGEAVKLVRHSWYEMVSQLALILLFRVDAIMVGLMCGATEAGLYGASVRLSELVYFVPHILASLYLPRMIELRQTDRVKYREQMTDYFSLSLLVAGGCAFCLAFGAPLMGWVFGEEFKAGSQILEVHAWSFIPYAIGIARTQYLTVENRLWVNLPSVVGALALNVALNWLWIPTHGGLGAAWATLVSYVLAWVVSSFFLPSVGRDVGMMLSQATAQMPKFVMLLFRQVRAER
jgi:O-antigen/teichoic acid export membrane protein